MQGHGSLRYMVWNPVILYSPQISDGFKNFKFSDLSSDFCLHRVDTCLVLVDFSNVFLISLPLLTIVQPH